MVTLSKMLFTTSKLNHTKEITTKNLEKKNNNTTSIKYLNLCLLIKTQ